MTQSQQASQCTTEKVVAEDPHAGPIVVGIGVPAGGLKALQTFFAALPDEPDMVFVVIAHLSPKHESIMAEL